MRGMIGDLPEKFVDYTDEELRAQLPYEWRRCVRNELDSALFCIDDENAEYVRRMNGINLYPPFVREHFSEFTDHLSGSLYAVSQNSRDQDEADNSFGKVASELSPVSAQAIRYAYVSNADIIMPGWCSNDLLAKLLDSDKTRFLVESRKYVGRIALLQHKNYFIDIAPRDNDEQNDGMFIGLVTHLTSEGLEMWDYLLNYHIEYDRRISE